MSDVINEEEFLGPVEETDWMLEGTETGNPVLDEYQPKGRRVRVERDIGGRWSGVRGWNNWGQSNIN